MKYCKGSGISTADAGRIYVAVAEPFQSLFPLISKEPVISIRQLYET